MRSFCHFWNSCAIHQYVHWGGGKRVSCVYSQCFWTFTTTPGFKTVGFLKEFNNLISHSHYFYEKPPRDRRQDRRLPARAVILLNKMYVLMEPYFQKVHKWRKSKSCDHLCNIEKRPKNVPKLCANREFKVCQIN